MKITGFTVLIITVIVFSSSCGEFPFMHSSAPLGAITFSSNDPSVQSTIQGRLISQRDLPMADDIQAVSDVYAEYGNLVGRHTPTKVVLPVGLGEIGLMTNTQMVFIMSPDLDNADDHSYFQADFSQPIVSDYISLATGEYTALSVPFINPNYLMYSDGYDSPFDAIYMPSYYHEIASIIEVELPGYATVFTDKLSVIPEPLEGKLIPMGGDVEIFLTNSNLEQPSSLFSDIEAVFYNRRNTARDTYQFSMKEILPRDPGGDISLIGNGITFSSELEAGTMSHSVLDYNSNSLAVPFDSLLVDGTVKKLLIVLNFDTTDIIEVYDNNTPADKTDDIVVIADKFWERFTISLVSGD